MKGFEQSGNIVGTCSCGRCRNTMPSEPRSSPAARQPPQRLLARLLWLVGAVIMASLLWFWPARRNYYFKRAEVRYRLDIPYAAG